MDKNDDMFVPDLREILADPPLPKLSPDADAVEVINAESQAKPLKPDTCAHDCIGDICEGCKNFIPLPPEDLEKGLHNILDAWLVCPNPDEIIERDILSLIQPLIEKARADTAREIGEELENRAKAGLAALPKDNPSEFWRGFWQGQIDEGKYLKSRWEGE